MLFKQWNEYSEPRHHLDAPLEENTDLDSLQPAPLPEVMLEKPIDTAGFKRAFIITNIFRSLFEDRLARAEQISSFVVAWQTKGREQHLYREDYQTQEDSRSTDETKRLEFPVHKLDDGTLFICVREDFLHVPPISINLLSREIAKLCGGLEVLLFGSSDRLERVKYVGFPGNVGKGLPLLTPPELITNFTASIMTQLLSNKVRFDGYVAPSEGPSGYEKLSMETMDLLIDLCWSEVRFGNREDYVKSCHRNWRLNGTVMGAQTGLYL